MPTQVGMRVKGLATMVLAVVMAAGLAACSSGDDDGDLSKGANIVIDDKGFKPDRLQVRVGQEVTFSVVNRDNREHTFTLTFLDIDQAIKAGQRVAIKMKAPNVPRDGFYSFYSKNHQFDGYQGQIKVVK